MQCGARFHLGEGLVVCIYVVRIRRVGAGEMWHWSGVAVPYFALKRRKKEREIYFVQVVEFFAFGMVRLCGMKVVIWAAGQR